MADDGKTQAPTDKKLREARKQGQFPRTHDAATWVGIAAGAALLPRSCQLLADQFRGLFLLRLPGVVSDPSPVHALDAVAAMPMAIIAPLAPLAIAALVGSLLATSAQGVYLTTKTLKPRFSRLSPKQGLKRMFGTKAVWEATKSLAKVLAIALVLWVVGQSLVPGLVGTGLVPLAVTMDRMRSGIQSLLWTAAATGLALAL